MYFPRFRYVFSPRLKVVLTAGFSYQKSNMMLNFCWAFFLHSLLWTSLPPSSHQINLLYFYVQEAFHVAKTAFRHFKIRVRKSLTSSYAGSNGFEDDVLDYIVCHLDLYDSQSSVNVSVGSFIGTGLLLLLFIMNTNNSEIHPA